MIDYKNPTDSHHYCFIMNVVIYNLYTDALALGSEPLQSSGYFVIYTGLYEITDVVLVQAISSFDDFAYCNFYV